MGLRVKILSGFLILSSMLLIAGVWSIHELSSIGTSVQQLLDDNYKSISAAKMMLEALEREDSATLLFLLGNREEGRKIMSEADNLFQKGFQIAQKNVTVTGEAAIVDLIRLRYDVYKGLLMKPRGGIDKEGNVDWYLKKVHTAFFDVRSSVEKLMALNDQTMYETASDLKNRANRVIMPGVVAIIAALLFSLMFNFFVNYYMVGPIIKITRSIEDFVDTGRPFDLRMETKDEIAHLASAVSSLSSKVRDR